MNKWKWALRAKRYWIAVLLILGISIVIIQNWIDIDSLKSILVCVGTSLISSAITIFLIKFDIMDMMQNNCLEEFGIIGILNGRDYIFKNSNEMSWMKENCW